MKGLVIYLYFASLLSFQCQTLNHLTFKGYQNTSCCLLTRYIVCKHLQVNNIYTDRFFCFYRSVSITHICCLMLLNATFNNISVISWWSVFLVCCFLGETTESLQNSLQAIMLFLGEDY
jgi:hypothetical protein